MTIWGEDIQKITELTEEVQQGFRKEMEAYKSDLHFKYDFYYRQYEGLYCYIYAIVVQSEYVRDYIKKINGEEISFEEVPFITITPIRRETQKIELKKDERPKVINYIEDIETSVSQFNFNELVNYIIENSALADNDLMKLAVSYRFANHVVDAARENKDSADKEVLRLQKSILQSIIITYNRLRRDLMMEYDEWELEKGTFRIP